MRVYRIERKKYLETTLKGIGAPRTDGYRWNSFNTYLVYTSESRALATLEVSVHLDLNEDLPTDRYYVEIDIPDDIEILELKHKDLPENWDFKPPILETQFIGDDFVNDNEAAILKVPSSIVKPEYNYLINPNHPDSKKITIVSKKSLKFDERFNKPKKINLKKLVPLSNIRNCGHSANRKFIEIKNKNTKSAKSVSSLL